MNLAQLHAIAPLDGRYAAQVDDLRKIWSESSLIHYRLIVACNWLQLLCPAAKKELKNLVNGFDERAVKRIKTIEEKTNHDVKAVEYFMREKIDPKFASMIHFGATSEDINNLAYGLMLQKARKEVLLPAMAEVISFLTKLAHDFAHYPMLSRTHGQAASPTTLGKELANFVVRLKRQKQQCSKITIMGKFNGAVGNFNALAHAYPEENWQQKTKEFVTSLGLTFNAYTTQIESHDNLAELFNAFNRFNTILLDCCRDIWGYISLGYVAQKVKKAEVGSSVMPHKVNPIDFENAEGNLGIANALLIHFANKLPISRWQRDLSDSTVMRNIGVALGHSLLAYRSILKGLNKLTINQEILEQDLANNWQVLAEAVQTVMRRYGIQDSYEQLKRLTRGKKITKEILHKFIANLNIPAKAKDDLLKLTPKTYLGYAVKLAKKC